jgi:hypothetical protein
MHKHLLIVAVLAGCMDLDSPVGGEAQNLAADDPGDEATTTDDHVPDPRIRAVKWAWDGCTPTPTPAVDLAGPPPAPLRLSVSVDATAAWGDVTVYGDPSGCDSFFGAMATVVCYPTLPPTGRRLALVAKGEYGTPHAISLPIEDCVDGFAMLPPDDCGDAK